MGDPKTWSKSDWLKAAKAWEVSPHSFAKAAASFARRKADGDPALRGIYSLNVAELR